MNGDPHHRFRERIDQVAAERDAATARAEKWRQRFYTMRRQRDAWRDRWLTTGINGRWRKR